MAITTASQSQLGQKTIRNSQIVATSVILRNSGASTGPSIASIIVTDNQYNNLDDTAAATSNGHIKILGTGFQSTANVFFSGTMVPKANITFVSSSELRVALPVFSIGNYTISVFNSNSAGALYSSSLAISTRPSWTTTSPLDTRETEISFSTTLSATSDSTITYSNTTALPAGTTLASNGLFSGTVTVASNTTFTFDVKATDLQLQDATRTFSITIFFPIAAPKIYLWGDNAYGKGSLGFASNYVTSPTILGSSTDWSILKCGKGGQNTAAIKTDGTLWMWGFNRFNGQLGHNNLTDIVSPKQVGATTNWLTVEHGGSGTMAIKTDGTLWGWGAGFNAGLGYAIRSSPVQIGANTNWSKLSVGHGQSFGIKTDGTLWYWGGGTGPQFGSFGNLQGGNASAYNTSSPRQLGTNTNWSLVSTSYHSVLATKTDGTLWAWGRNNGFSNDGQLGINSTIHRSSPTQVGTANNWIDVATNVGSSPFTFATRGKKFSNTSGNLFVWGAGGNDRALGLSGDTANKSSPVQLGSFDSWSVPSAGPDAGGAILK